MKIDQEGRTLHQETYHITGNGTVTVVDHSVFAESILVSVTNGGAGWTFTLKNRESIPKALLPPIVLEPPGPDEFSPGKLFNPNPKRVFWMEGGIQIVTAGTTPGIIDVWITYNDEI